MGGSSRHIVSVSVAARLLGCNSHQGPHLGHQVFTESKAAIPSRKRHVGRREPIAKTGEFYSLLRSLNSGQHQRKLSSQFVSNVLSTAVNASGGSERPTIDSAYLDTLVSGLGDSARPDGELGPHRLVPLTGAREVLFQAVHSVSCFFSLSNNLGNLLFARRTTPTAVSDGLLIQF
jgi:hypothetical protein